MARLLTFALIMGMAAQAQAVLIVGTSTPTPTTVRNNGTDDFDGIIGFNFQLDPGTYTLDSLMFWDGPGNTTDPDTGTAGDGLEDGVNVRFWIDGVQQANLVFTPAAPGALNGDYRTGTPNITGGSFTGSSFTATGAEVFTLSANVDLGDNAFFNQAATPVGFVSNLQSAFENSVDDDNDFPDVLGNAGNGHFGPNAGITQVPEPGSWAFLGLVGVAAAGRRWKKSLTVA